jgi:hypothetical protein
MFIDKESTPYLGADPCAINIGLLPESDKLPSAYCKQAPSERD